MSSSPSGSDGVSSRLRNLVHPAKPEIKITLDGSTKSYSTMDEIRGTVSITAPVDTAYDVLEIQFVGTSRTYVEGLATTAAVTRRLEAFHQFLKLTQPNLDAHYPEDGLLKAGWRYDFPFVFAVPQQLLLRICQHKVQSPALRDAHLQLPPSFGDRDVADQPDALDDMAPEMANVRYGVFAKFSKYKRDGDELKTSTVASKARRLRVIPAYDEQPPLSVHEKDGDYVLRKEKKIKKNVFKGKLGSLVMEAQQPQSLRLPSPHGDTQFRVSTTATVMLRFDPAEESVLPPKLGSLSSKLKASTYFGSTARHAFPTKAATLLDVSQGVHAEHMQLSSRCVANVEWQKRYPDTPERRDSAASVGSLYTGSIPAPSDAYKGRSYYTAKLIVPITLPDKKAFVPTFHSCLISRVYTLGMSLNLHNAGLGGSMDLKVPVQISSEGSNGEPSPHRGSVGSNVETTVDDEDISHFLEARMLLVPRGQLLGRSRVGSAPTVNGDAPPDYSFFASGASGASGAQRHMSVPVY